MSGVSDINILDAFYDIHVRKGIIEYLFLKWINM
jgi:hypothetical protein